MNKIIISALLVFHCLKLFTQTNNSESDELLHQKLESIAENQSTEDIDFTMLEEQMLYFKEHPLNINAATAEQLQQLIVLNDIQINNLLIHIQQNGNLLNVYELQTIDGFDVQTINSILPYITVNNELNPVDKLTDELKNGQQKVLLRYQRVLENQKGYNTTGNGYLGSPDKLFARYQFNAANKLMFGFTGEKDPGEQFFKGAQKTGFDFYSAHILIKDIGKLKTLAIGDYQLQIGQGLVAWSGLAFNKTSDAIAIKRDAFGIRPHTSTDENSFFRGVAGTAQFKKVYLTGFVSRKNIDGNITDTLTNGDAAAVSSLQQTGEHATNSELADKHSVKQTIVGGDISFKARKWDIGATTMFTDLSAQLTPSLKPYNQFNFRGKQLLNSSVHYSSLVRNFNFFGETAASDNGGIAYVNGVLIALDKRVSLSILNRNYQRNYQSLMGNAFSEGASPANERGTYAGLQVKPSSTISINSYMDVFSFPWLRYQITAPSQGYEYFTQLNYTPNKKFNVYARFRNKQKLNDLNYVTEMNVPVPVKQNNYRLNLSYTVNNNLRLASRVEWLTWQQQGLPLEKGFLISQDVHLKPTKLPLTFIVRYALFSTDSYNSRIYSYENDMPFTYSIPAYFNKGSRAYLMIAYDVNKNLSFWLRYSQTFYDNVTVISPGALTEIDGNTKSEIKAELRYVFR